MGLVSLVFRNKLTDGFSICQIDDVVLVSLLITSDLLIWSISPISIHSELVYSLLRVQELREVVGGWRLIQSQTLLGNTESFHIVTGFNFLHPFTLPIVEMAHYFNNFAAERPLENMLNFRHEMALHILQLELG